MKTIKISQLIVLLERAQAEVGDLDVIGNGGVEVLGLAYVYEIGKINPKVTSVRVA